MRDDLIEAHLLNQQHAAKASEDTDQQSTDSNVDVDLGETSELQASVLLPAFSPTNLSGRESLRPNNPHAAWIAKRSCSEPPSPRNTISGRKDSRVSASVSIFDGSLLAHSQSWASEGGAARASSSRSAASPSGLAAPTDQSFILSSLDRTFATDISVADTDRGHNTPLRQSAIASEGRSSVRAEASPDRVTDEGRQGLNLTHGGESSSRGRPSAPYVVNDTAAELYHAGAGLLFVAHRSIRTGSPSVAHGAPPRAEPSPAVAKPDHGPAVRPSALDDSIKQRLDEVLARVLAVQRSAGAVQGLAQALVGGGSTEADRGDHDDHGYPQGNEDRGEEEEETDVMTVGLRHVQRQGGHIGHGGSMSGGGHAAAGGRGWHGGGVHMQPYGQPGPTGTGHGSAVARYLSGNPTAAFGRVQPDDRDDGPLPSPALTVLPDGSPLEHPLATADVSPTMASFAAGGFELSHARGSAFAVRSGEHHGVAQGPLERPGLHAHAGKGHATGRLDLPTSASASELHDTMGMGGDGAGHDDARQPIGSAEDNPETGRGTLDQPRDLPTARPVTAPASPPVVMSTVPLYEQTARPEPAQMVTATSAAAAGVQGTAAAGLGSVPAAATSVQPPSAATATHHSHGAPRGGMTSYAPAPYSPRDFTYGARASSSAYALDSGMHAPVPTVSTGGSGSGPASGGATGSGAPGGSVGSPTWPSGHERLSPSAAVRALGRLQEAQRIGRGAGAYGATTAGPSTSPPSGVLGLGPSAAAPSSFGRTGAWTRPGFSQPIRASHNIGQGGQGLGLFGQASHAATSNTSGVPSGPSFSNSNNIAAVAAAIANDVLHEAGTSAGVGAAVPAPVQVSSGPAPLQPHAHVSTSTSTFAPAALSQMFLSEELHLYNHGNGSGSWSPPHAAQLAHARGWSPAVLSGAQGAAAGQLGHGMGHGSMTSGHRRSARAASVDAGMSVAMSVAASVADPTLSIGRMSVGSVGSFGRGTLDGLGFGTSRPWSRAHSRPHSRDNESRGGETTADGLGEAASQATGDGTGSSPASSASPHGSPNLVGMGQGAAATLAAGAGSGGEAEGEHNDQATVARTHRSSGAAHHHRLKAAGAGRHPHHSSGRKEPLAGQLEALHSSGQGHSHSTGAGVGSATGTDLSPTTGPWAVVGGHAIGTGPASPAALPGASTGAPTSNNSSPVPGTGSPGLSATGANSSINTVQSAAAVHSRPMPSGQKAFSQHFSSAGGASGSAFTSTGSASAVLAVSAEGQAIRPTAAATVGTAAAGPVHAPIAAGPAAGHSAFGSVSAAAFSVPQPRPTAFGNVGSVSRSAGLGTAPSSSAAPGAGGSPNVGPARPVPVPALHPHALGLSSFGPQAVPGSSAAAVAAGPVPAPVAEGTAQAADGAGAVKPSARYAPSPVQITSRAPPDVVAVPAAVPAVAPAVPMALMTGPRPNGGAASGAQGMGMVTVQPLAAGATGNSGFAAIGLTRTPGLNLHSASPFAPAAARTSSSGPGPALAGHGMAHGGQLPGNQAYPDTSLYQGHGMLVSGSGRGGGAWAAAAGASGAGTGPGKGKPGTAHGHRPGHGGSAGTSTSSTVPKTSGHNQGHSAAAYAMLQKAETAMHAMQSQHAMQTEGHRHASQYQQALGAPGHDHDHDHGHARTIGSAAVTGQNPLNSASAPALVSHGQAVGGQSLSYATVAVQGSASAPVGHSSGSNKAGAGKSTVFTSPARPTAQKHGHSKHQHGHGHVQAQALQSDARSIGSGGTAGSGPHRDGRHHGASHQRHGQHHHQSGWASGQGMGGGSAPALLVHPPALPGSLMPLQQHHQHHGPLSGPAGTTGEQVHADVHGPGAGSWYAAAGSLHQHARPVGGPSSGPGTGFGAPGSGAGTGAAATATSLLGAGSAFKAARSKRT